MATPTPPQLQAQYNQYKELLGSIASKEKDEHQLVISTMQNCDPKRTCYRLIGGVLVQRHVEDVLPNVQANMDGIKMILTQLMTNYKKKELELADFQKKYNIEVRAAN